MGMGASIGYNLWVRGASIGYNLWVRGASIRV